MPQRRPWRHVWAKLEPKTLAGQLIAVTALAVLLSNAMVVAWFTVGHLHDNDEMRTERLLDRATATAILMNRIPPGIRETALRALSNDFRGLFSLRHGHFVTVAMNDVEAGLAGRLRSMLPADMRARPIEVHFAPTLMPPPLPLSRPPGSDHPTLMPPPLPRPPGADHPPMMAPLRGEVLEVVIPISDDTQLVAFFFRARGPAWSAQLLLAAILTILLSSLAAGFIAQRVTRPLAKLAEAAALTAHGAQTPTVPEEGPQDVRRAAAAFNAMTERVSRTLESQRHLLSAVGHDLRTPITAMRINIEFVEDAELADRLVKNLDELQALTEAVLSAARGVSGEALRPIDVTALVESVCADLDDLKVPVVWRGGASCTVSCRPNELRRAVRNLIENAVAYGQTAEVSVAAAPTAWEIRIADEGQGIPEADRTRVFEPFVRLEGSRNAATGGVGLGLTLARTIVESHGGAIAMGPRPDRDGFLVRIVLPRPV